MRVAKLMLYSNVFFVVIYIVETKIRVFSYCFVDMVGVSHTFFFCFEYKLWLIFFISWKFNRFCTYNLVALRRDEGEVGVSKKFCSKEFVYCYSLYRNWQIRTSISYSLNLFKKLMLVNITKKQVKRRERKWYIRF